MTPLSILLAAVFLGTGNFSSKIVILTVWVSTVKTISFPFIVPLQFIPERQDGYGGNSWLKKLKDARLEREECNVILVDWSRGASFPYMQASENTRLVGYMLCYAMLCLLSSWFLRMLVLLIWLIDSTLWGFVSGHKSPDTLGQIWGAMAWCWVE